MSNADEEAQADEITALASIFEERIFVADDNNGGQFSAYLELPKEFFIKLEGPHIQQANKYGIKLLEDSDGHATLLRISYLPPIVLNFQYLPDYPSHSAPAFTISCKWLSVAKLSQLCSHLDQLWEENHSEAGEVIIFQWVQFLVDESLQLLNVQSPLSLDFHKVLRSNSFEVAEEGSIDNSTVQHAANAFHEPVKRAVLAENETDNSILDTRAIQDIGCANLLLRTLIEHDRAERQRVFNTSFYNCQVCFSDKTGSDCMDFQGCSHVYCKECMREYFQVQIGEGNVKGLNCPETKCNSPALPSQVRELVGKELFATYDRLLLQRTLECMEDIVYCPRVLCQCPVMKEKDSTICVCTACAFPFCVKCRMAYHGVSPCRLKKDEILKLRKEFEEGDEETRARLEQRFGRRVFRDVLEEFESQRWMDKNSKECPKCHTNIEKIDGCNKMACSQCRSFFCWICLKILSHAIPYKHFNDPKSKCFNQLFTGTVPNANRDFDNEYEDVNDVDDWFFV
ncbi:E3 ubiquitin-protein ligase RNF14-like [Asterias amurensis]|uniref:E3 ubiquitin-protein ligase RNF14-like n=1 Tax=Asterias amurensis TaxID=7602 RepID=UPI003AB6C5B9